MRCNFSAAVPGEVELHPGLTWKQHTCRWAEAWSPCPRAVLVRMCSRHYGSSRSCLRICWCYFVCGN